MENLDENNVKIKPWVGKNYMKGGLLILGESHYEEDIKYRNEKYTIESIEEVLKGKRVRFFTKIAKTVLDKPGDLSKEEVEKIWNHVIYYNFVQEFLSTSRKEPLPKSWENGAEPFKSVIKKYAPRKVLLLGKRLTKHLLYIGLIEGSEEKYKVTCLDGIVAVSIYHPSCGGFSPTRWSGVLRENGFIENYFE